MKTRTVVTFVIVGATAIAALSLRQQSPRLVKPELGASGTPAKVATVGSSPSNASVSPDAAEPRAGVAPASSSQSPRYAEPNEIETELAQFFAAQSGLEIVSLSSIDCSSTACEIVLTGTEVNPRYVDAYSDLFHKLTATQWNDFRVRSAGLGTREVAPGAREYVMTFQYQPLVDLSADALIAARQYAECAAAWRRATENPTPDDIVRAYLEEADRNIALAASVLGSEQATRIATDTRGGPVIRVCF